MSYFTFLDDHLNKKKEEYNEELQKLGKLWGNKFDVLMDKYVDSDLIESNNCLKPLLDYKNWWDFLWSMLRFYVINTIKSPYYAFRDTYQISYDFYACFWLFVPYLAITAGIPITLILIFLEADPIVTICCCIPFCIIGILPIQCYNLLKIQYDLIKNIIIFTSHYEYNKKHPEEIKEAWSFVYNCAIDRLETAYVECGFKGEKMNVSKEMPDCSIKDLIQYIKNIDNEADRVIYNSEKYKKQVQLVNQLAKEVDKLQLERNRELR